LGVDEFFDKVGGKMSQLGKPLIRRKLARQFQQGIEKVPVATIRQMIEEEATPQLIIQMFGGDEAEVKAGAKQWAWVGAMFSDQELCQLLPKWTMVVLSEYGEQGQQWLLRELAHTRDILFTEEDSGQPEPGRQPDNQLGAGANQPVKAFVYRVRKPGQSRPAPTAPGGGPAAQG